MSCTNYYCAGDHCRRTTQRLCVRMMNRTYYYCVVCGRRLELRGEYEQNRGGGRQSSLASGTYPQM